MIQAFEKVSKNGKTYYGLFYCYNDCEILICFLTKKQFDLLQD